MVALHRRLLAEGFGTALLLATVVGSGIMAEKLAGGNVAIALLGNTIPTGAILVVLILLFGPLSGAHFNPVVTLVSFLRREMKATDTLAYIAVQIVAAIIGVGLAHLMFDLPMLQTSVKLRTGTGQWIAESVATFGLLLTILGLVAQKSSAIPYAVGLYITAAYWFTASTSFANPAVTIARTFTNTFAGIAPASAPAFILAQVLGAGLAVLVGKLMFDDAKA